MLRPSTELTHLLSANRKHKKSHKEELGTINNAQTNSSSSSSDTLEEVVVGPDHVEGELYNRKTEKFPTLIENVKACIAILEKTPSPAYRTNKEWAVGLYTILAIAASPAAIWAITYILVGKPLRESSAFMQQRIDNATKSGANWEVIRDLKEQKSEMDDDLVVLNVAPSIMTPVIALVAIYFLYDCCLKPKEHKKSIAFYENLSLADCLKDQDPNDVEKIINITSMLEISFKDTTRAKLLSELKKVENYVERIEKDTKRNHYEKFYLFWKGTKEYGLENTLFIPNDLYRKMFFTLFNTKDKKGTLAKLEKYVLPNRISAKISEERKKILEEKVTPGLQF